MTEDISNYGRSVNVSWGELYRTKEELIPALEIAIIDLKKCAKACADLSEFIEYAVRKLEVFNAG